MTSRVATRPMLQGNSDVTTNQPAGSIRCAQGRVAATRRDLFGYVFRYADRREADGSMERARTSARNRSRLTPEALYAPLRRLPPAALRAYSAGSRGAG